MNRTLKIKDKTGRTEGIKIAPFKKDIRKTSPHKHNNYFEIVYLEKGSGQHTIDSQKFDIRPPIVFLIRKKQVHFWNIESEPEGFVLIIKKPFLDNSLDKEIKLLLSKISAFSCLHPRDGETTGQLFQLLEKEYRENSLVNNAVTEGLLKALLAKLLQSEKPVFSIAYTDNLYQKFRDLLTQEKNPVNKVARYAQMLNTTPQNLNAVCRRENGQSATETLAEFIIGEAKRLLLYTDLTVMEISRTLDFKDNSHFTKYFKRHTGVAPKAFRCAIR